MRHRPHRHGRGDRLGLGVAAVGPTPPQGASCASLREPILAEASFDFAISDAKRLSGATPIDGSEKWRGSSQARTQTMARHTEGDSADAGHEPNRSF